MKKRELFDMRKEYSGTARFAQSPPHNPIDLFSRWFDDALNNESHEPNAMILSTAGKNGEPSARVVLLKQFSEEGFQFFTNYNSKKAKDIMENSRVSLLFFWIQAMRQVRISGIATRTTEEVSENYFKTRPRENQASSALSRQSEILTDSDKFGNMVYELIESDNAIKRPAHWGGYTIEPFSYEFWQGSQGRLHTRLFYSKENESLWKHQLLYP